MTTVFIGGSRAISRLAPEVAQRLDRIIEKNFPVLLGDANGADKAVQKYLESKHYRNVEVFCSGDISRNNIGNWEPRRVSSKPRERNFDFYAAKDRLMTERATVGFMIWDGKSVGTLLNVKRLLRRQKKVVVYDASRGQFSELKAESEWQPFVFRYDEDLRKRVEEKALVEESSAPPLQSSFVD
jgi:hypothetical protein